MKPLIRIVLVALLLVSSVASADEVADLIAKLGSGDSAAVQSAAKALGGMGGGASAALGPLFDVMSEGDVKSKIESVKALRSIGGADRDALVEQILGNDDIMGKLSELAGGSNPLLGRAAEQLGTDSVGALTGKLADATDADAQKKLIGALGSAGPLAEQAVPDLQKLVDGASDESVREEASAALDKIKAPSKKKKPKIPGG